MVGGKLSSFVPQVIHFIYSLDNVLSFVLSPHKIGMQQAKQPWSSCLTAYSLIFFPGAKDGHGCGAIF